MSGQGTEALEKVNQKLAEKIGIDLDRLPSKEAHAEAIDDMSWPTFKVRTDGA